MEVTVLAGNVTYPPDEPRIGPKSNDEISLEKLTAQRS